MRRHFSFAESCSPCASEHVSGRPLIGQPQDATLHSTPFSSLILFEYELNVTFSFFIFAFYTSLKISVIIYFVSLWYKMKVTQYTTELIIESLPVNEIHSFNFFGANHNQLLRKSGDFSQNYHLAGWSPERFFVI